MLHRFIKLTGLFLFSVSLFGSAEESRLISYYNIAEGNYLIGDRRGAERGIEQCLRIDPDHGPSLTLKARILLEKSEPEAALQAIEKAVTSRPEDLEYKVVKALILGQLERREDALSLIDEVLDKAEASSEEAQTAQRLKGLLKMADAEWDEAAEAFKATYELKPEDSEADRKLAAEAYLEKARTAPKLEEALAAVQQAIQLYRGQTGRENLQALSRLEIKRAQLLAQMGKPDQATAVLQQIVGSQPDNLEATITLASLYASQEEWAALEDLIEPIAQNANLLDIALYLEGRAALARDRVGTARAKFEEALKINAKQPSALQHALEFYHSICFEKLGRREKAEQSLNNAVAGGYTPESSEEAVHLGRLLIRQNDWDTLIPILERALLRGHTSAEGWALLGRAHLKKEQNSFAISAFNQSLALDPEQADTLALRGSLLRKLGDLLGALSDYERAHRLEASNPVLSYERGLVLLQLGRIDEAEGFLEKAARKLTAQPTLDLLHASCAYTLGNYDAAAQSLKKYLELELKNESLQQFSNTGFYLQVLLAQKENIPLSKPSPKNEAAQLFIRYWDGEVDRKEVLDWSGRAETPELARRQIGSTSFWLAQVEVDRGNDQTAKQLLEIALEAGSHKNPEWQFARWQLKQLKD